MYQYLALTSLRDSRPLPTRHIRELGTYRQLTSILPFPYFRFHFSVFHLAYRFGGLSEKFGIIRLKSALTRNVYIRLVNLFHDPYQALSSTSMSNEPINCAGEHR